MALLKGVLATVLVKPLSYFSLRFIQYDARHVAAKTATEVQSRVISRVAKHALLKSVPFGKNHRMMPFASSLLSHSQLLYGCA